MFTTKSRKILKIDGILLILFNLIVVINAVIKTPRIAFTTDTLSLAIIEFIMSLAINTWWAIDSKKWITNKQHRKVIWLFILIQSILLISITLFMATNQLTAASMLVYTLVFVSAIGIGLIMRYV